MILCFLRLVDILALSFIYKLIIGRKEGKNNYLNGYKNQFISVYCSLHIGPLTLIDGGLTKMMSNTTAQVLGRFTQGNYGI